MAKHRNKKKPANVVGNEVIKAESKPIENNNRTILTARTQRTEAFSGPLPHPDHLERYGKIIENGAERIFKMAENQADHRMTIEKSLVQADIRRSDFGLLYGFVLSLVVTGSGVWITLQDKSVVGFITMLAPLASIVALFVYNRQTQRKDEEIQSSKEKKKK